jgi:hypothetical protein
MIAHNAPPPLIIVSTTDRLMQTYAVVYRNYAAVAPSAHQGLIDDEYLHTKHSTLIPSNLKT